MIPIDGDFILAIAPKFSGRRAMAQYEIVNALSTALTPILGSYGISSKLRIAHFFGQVTHECAGFSTTEEFASGAAYEGRRDLGNTQKGDGKRYKGRGLIQLTGRENYRNIGAKLQLPLEEQPEIAAEPVISLKIACEYWKSRDINLAADRDDLIRVTKLVNGGLNGLEDRRKYLQKAKNVLSSIEGIAISTRQGGQSVVLRRGSFGELVSDLQEMLISHGYHISIDNDFGPATELAVKLFQKSKGLLPDGIVGEETWMALKN